MFTNTRSPIASHDCFSAAIRVLLVPLFVQAIFFAMAQRHLFADGAWFFLRSVLTGEVGYDPHRYSAQVLTHLPHIALYWSGVRDLEFLSAVYGATLFLQLPLTITAVQYILRKEETLFLCLAFVLVASTLVSHLFIVSETLTYLCATLVVVAYVLARRGGGRWTRPMVAVAAVTLVAAYETAAVSNMFLIFALTLMRRREGRSAFDDLVMFVLLGGIIYQLASAVGGLNSNLEHFLSSLPFLALPAGLALAVIAISWLIPGDRALLLGLAPASVAALVLSVLVRERSTLDFEMLVVRSSYALRVTNVATALVVSLLAVFAARLERWISAPRRQSRRASLRPLLVRAIVLLLTTFVTFQTYLTLEWDRYLGALTSFVTSGEGIVQYDRCPPCIRPSDLSLVDFGWAWSYPTLTLLLGSFHNAGQSVVVLNHEIGWEPFPTAEIPRIRNALDQ